MIDHRTFRLRVMFFILVIVDQLTKWWAISSGVSILNTGVSFRLLAQLPVWGISLLTFCVGCGLFWLLRDRWRSAGGALTLVLAGGVSNLIDRLRLGGVIDFLPIPLTALHNNLADWLIAGGLLWLLISEWRRGVVERAVT